GSRVGSARYPGPRARLRCAVRARRPTRGARSRARPAHAARGGWGWRLARAQRSRRVLWAARALRAAASAICAADVRLARVRACPRRLAARQAAVGAATARRARARTELSTAARARDAPRGDGGYHARRVVVFGLQLRHSHRRERARARPAAHA